jgi:hypothetical protein
LAARFPEGAYYLAEYAIECAFKACIAKRTQQHDFPEKGSHKYFSHPRTMMYVGKEEDSLYYWEGESMDCHILQLLQSL